MHDNTLSNIQLVTIALGNLGGHEKQIDTEDIAIHVDELAPGKFSWRKYPQHIDLQVVNQSLQDARRERNGGLVLGNSARGWTLSQAGMEWIKNTNIADNRSLADLVSFRRGSLLLSQELEIRRLLDTNAFALFCEGKTVKLTRNDFFNFAKINEYFPQKARQRRFTFIESTISENEQLQGLWQFLKNRFAKEFE